MKYTDMNVLFFVYSSLFYGHLLAIRSGDIIFNRKFTNYSFKLKDLVPVTLQPCQKACKLRVSCQSINFNRFLRLCQLYSVKSGNSQDFVQAKGWIHIENITLEIGHCENNTCLLGEVCVENETSYVCKHEECSPIQQGNIKGKGNMNDIGSRKCIDCTDGHLTNVSFVPICNDAGKWAPSFGKCERGYCYQPEIDERVIWTEAKLIASDGVLYLNNSNKNYSDLATISFTNGSKLKFNCIEELTMFWSHEKYCVNGTWSSEPWCFETRIDAYCQNTQDCEVPDLPYSSGLSCNNNTCDCPFGYGYSYSRFQCFDRCPNDAFATTFRKTTGVVTYSYNTQVIYGLSENACKDRCIDEANFVCRSFEHLHSLNNRCNLQTIVYADVPESFLYMTASYYQRDCL